FQRRSERLRPLHEIGTQVDFAAERRLDGEIVHDFFAAENVVRGDRRGASSAHAEDFERRVFRVCNARETGNGDKESHNEASVRVLTRQPATGAGFSALHTKSSPARITWPSAVSSGSKHF